MDRRHPVRSHFCVSGRLLGEPLWANAPLHVALTVWLTPYRVCLWP